jgi:hypothetical protein
MITPGEVREHLREAEAFLRGGDPYGATARARLAARKAEAMSSHDGAEVREEVELALDRFQAAQEAMRMEVERRGALHVANERRAAGISDVVPEPAPPRRSWLAELLGRREHTRTEQRAVYTLGT